MRIANHQLDTSESSGHQPLQKLPPMNFLRTERHGHPQHLASASPVHPGGDQHRRIAYLAILAHLFVARIEIQIRDLAQPTGAPLLDNATPLL